MANKDSKDKEWAEQNGTVKSPVSIWIREIYQERQEALRKKAQREANGM